VHNLLVKVYDLLIVSLYLEVVGSRGNPKIWFLKVDYIKSFVKIILMGGDFKEKSHFVKKTTFLGGLST